MNDARIPRPRARDPAQCRHPGFVRAGIQKAPVPPYRLYLLTCRGCGTTLATQTLRTQRRVARTPPEPAATLEEDTAGPRRRRRAG